MMMILWGCAPAGHEDIMKSVPIEVVIFDFDGTLVHLAIDFGRMRDEVIAIVRSHGVDDPALFSLRVWELVNEAAICLEKRGGAAAQMRAEAYEAIESIELEAARRARLISGVPLMLADLRSRAVAVAIVTRNSGAAARMAFSGIEEACDVFLPREAVAHVKPHPAHLERCFEILGSEPPWGLMVGDHPLDIQTGRQFGMRTAGVLTGSGTERDLMAAGADYIFDDVTGVLTLFNK
jgi:phosphoglycolate phosphatase